MLRLQCCLLFFSARICVLQGLRNINGEDKFAAIEKLLQKQNQELSELRDRNVYQDQKIHELEERLTTLSSMRDEHPLQPATKYAKSSFGCISKEIHISCSGNKSILVTSADYGEYSTTCESVCCVPNPLDCTELVAENNEGAWAELKLTCDNKTECTFLYQGSTFLQDCAVSATADYMNIYYSCLPEDSALLPSFTAYATTPRDYSANEIILFDGILSNFGEYYQPESSVFLCPVNGIYVFSVCVLSNYGCPLLSYIMKDNVQLSHQVAENVVDNNRMAASGFVIAECLVGQRVWIKSDGNQYCMRGSNQMPSTFSGYLLQSLQ